MQDFTGVPAVVDLAAMREAVKRLGGDTAKVNPLSPVDLVIDHSVTVDRFGQKRHIARASEGAFGLIGNCNSEARKACEDARCSYRFHQDRGCRSFQSRLTGKHAYMQDTES